MALSLNMTRTYRLFLLTNTILLLIYSIVSCEQKSINKSLSLNQILEKQKGIKAIKKIYLSKNIILTQSFFGDGTPNIIKLFRWKNNQYTCLDSMTFYFQDDLLKPDTIHLDQTYNCFITNSGHSGTGIYGESIHFLIIKNNRIIQLFDQLKYLSIVDPESLPKTTFTVSTEILEFHKEEIKLKATIIQGEIQDDESGKEVENSRETDTIEYRINPKKSIYIYHNSKLPTYKERWKNGHFI